MQKTSKRYIHSVVLPLFVFFIAICAMIVLNRKYLMSGVDFMFHRLRLAGLVQSLQNGDLFPRINYVMCMQHGYGAPMFYGQWWMYLPAVLMIFGMSFNKAWLAAIAVTYFVACVINHWVAVKLGADTKRAVLISLLFVFNPLMTQIVNGDLPFAICLYLIPALCYMLYSILYLKNYNTKTAVLLGIIAAIIVKTHILSTLMAVVVVALFLIINIKKSSVKAWITIAKACIATILFSASFLLPMIEQLFSQKLKVIADGGVFRSHQVFGFSELIINSFSDIQSSIAAYPQISLVGIILLIVCTLQFKQLSEFAKKLILLCGVLLVMSTNTFPWSIMQSTPLGMVQFVGRYAVMALCIIMLIVMCNKSIPKAVLGFCVLLVICSTISHCILPDVSDTKAVQAFKNGETFVANASYYESLETQVQTAIDGTLKVDGISGGEYLNACADKNVVTTDKSLEPKSNSVKITSFNKSYGNISFDYEGDGAVTVPFLWYKGYRAVYTNNAKGTQPELNTSSNGYITLNVNGKGSVSVEYKWTAIQIISFIITFLSMVILLSYSVYIYIKKPNTLYPYHNKKRAET